MKEKQFMSSDFGWMFVYFFVTSIVFVFYNILKIAKRRTKYNALLPGMKIAWHEVMACLRYINRSEICSFQSSALQLLAGNAKVFQQEKLFCVWLIYHPMVYLLKGEAVEEMLKNAAIQRKDFMYKILVPLFGDGIVTSSGEKWKCRRRLLNPCFHLRILKDFIPIFNVQARKLVKHLQRGTDDEIRLLNKPLFSCALDMAYETNFGINREVQGIETRRLADIFISIKIVFMERLLNWWMWPYIIFRFTKSCRIYNESLKIAHKYTDEIFRQKKKQYVSRNPEEKMKKHNSLLDFLLEYHMESKTISEEGVKEELNTFIAGATDTTSLTLTYALYFIGQHEDIQANLHLEVDRIFGEDKERSVENEDLIQMKYIDCVLKETMRLFPPIPIISRTVAQNTNICGYSIPEGASCVICPYILHRDPEAFPNPEKFDPTRFFPENSASRHPFAYIPFNAGPRNCIGQKYAMMAMKTILSTILRHFTVESLDERDKLILGIEMTLEPSTPLRFQLKRRI